MQNTRASEDHKSMESHFNIINKFDQRTRNQGNIDSDKQTQVIKNPHKNKIKTETIGNLKKCGGIGI